MNQLLVFDKNISEKKKKIIKGNLWELYIDGASRNNPGLAGAGVYVLKNHEPFLQKSFFLGIRTNNQAEYFALMLGLFLLEKVLEKDDEINIFSDSELLVRQFSGVYKVKDVFLKNFFQCAKLFLSDKKHEFKHVLREKNQIADSLANKGVDQKKDLIPEEFDNFCERYKGYV